MINAAIEYIRLTQEDHEAARLVVKGPDFWAEVLKERPGLKSEVALNKALPEETLRLLAGDADSNVRLSVAMKNKLPQDIFPMLADDESDSVRMAFARNKGTPRQVLEKLSEDPWSEISLIAARRITTQ